MDSRTTRRDVLAGLTTGAALAMASGVASGSSSEANPTKGQSELELKNPATEYPHPPFAAQEQPWPGLASKMQPPPDHGEHSYRGSGRLSGRKALITGGDSGIGRAAAIAFAREGADVAINYLPQEESDAREVVTLIAQAGRKAVPIPGDIREEAFCQQLVSQAVQALGGLDILVDIAARQVAKNSILGSLPSNSMQRSRRICTRYFGSRRRRCRT